LAGLCCRGGRCATGTVLAREDGIRPAPITGGKTQLPGLAHRQPLGTLVVGPPAPSKVVPRVLVNHEDLIGELEDHQQIRCVGVLFPWLTIAAVAIFVLDLTGHIALLRGRGP